MSTGPDTLLLEKEIRNVFLARMSSNLGDASGLQTNNDGDAHSCTFARETQSEIFHLPITLKLKNAQWVIAQTIGTRSSAQEIKIKSRRDGFGSEMELHGKRVCSVFLPTFLTWNTAGSSSKANEWPGSRMFILKISPIWRETCNYRLHLRSLSLLISVEIL